MVILPLQTISAFAPGGSLGPPIVMAVNDAGVSRAVLHTVAPPVLGVGNPARVVPGIDRSLAECQAQGTCRVRERAGSSRLPVVPNAGAARALAVPEAAIVAAG
jgi:hypothetical protein